MIGTVANAHRALSRRILREHGFAYITGYVCGPRVRRALPIIVFNRQDPDECQRMRHCYSALMASYAEAGQPISRAPLDFQAEAMRRLETWPQVCSDIKKVLDPKGILSPSTYGIG